MSLVLLLRSRWIWRRLPSPSPPLAAPAPAGPHSGGSKSVLDGMAGPSMKPVELEELVGSSMKLVHLEEMAGPSMKPVELEELDPMGDVDKQRLKWETINEDQQVWDALDEQRKGSMITAGLQVIS